MKTCKYDKHTKAIDGVHPWNKRRTHFRADQYRSKHTNHKIFTIFTPYVYFVNDKAEHIQCWSLHLATNLKCERYKNMIYMMFKGTNKNI